MTDGREITSEEPITAEPEIAFDESAVAEPEVEPDDSSRTEHAAEPEERAEAEAEPETGCPNLMGRTAGPRCGRKLHDTPDGVDKQPVCLMHSNDERKQSWPLLDEFWRIFEQILEEAREGEAHFEEFVFPEANLDQRTFLAICRFGFATFTKAANFNVATFAQTADFIGATFTECAYFFKATFMQNGVLSSTFMQYAEFREATFMRDADFSGAKFAQTANFEETKFDGTTFWNACRFLDQVEFRHTAFRPKKGGTPSAVFSLAKFAKPEEAIFHGVDLSRALFVHCDVSELWFTPSVEWARRKGNRGLAVFEETILHDPTLWEMWDWYGPLDHGAVEQIYHQLKKNYDARLDYRKANEFHFGEMEMRRLEVRKVRGFLRPWGWLRRRIGPEAWYRYASDYGNSFVKPTLWLLTIMVLAAAIFPIPGLELRQQSSQLKQSGSRPTETYLSTWDKQSGWMSNLGAESKLIGESAIAAVDMATFQRNPEYTPAYPWGRVLAILETLLTSTLFGLFLLAIRRQFRR